MTSFCLWGLEGGIPNRALQTRDRSRSPGRRGSPGRALEGEEATAGVEPRSAVGVVEWSTVNRKEDYNLQFVE